MADSTSDPAQKRALATVRSAIEDERSERAQAEERGARSAVGAGAVLVRELRNTYRDLVRSRTMVALEEADPKNRTAGGREHIEELRSRLSFAEGSNATSFDILSSLVLQQLDLPQVRIESQLQVWLKENARPEFVNLRRFAGMFVAEIAQARPKRGTDRVALFRRLTSDIQ